MCFFKRPSGNAQLQGTVQANILGNVRIPSGLLNKLVHPNATPLHQVPKNNQVEVSLAKIENLLGKGHYGAALREANALQIGDSPVAAQYEFIRQEKILRIHIGIGDRYFIRGDAENAKKFYESAIQLETTNTTLQSVSRLADQTFKHLVDQRYTLFGQLKRIIKQDSYEDWCKTKKEIKDSTIINVNDFTKFILPDFIVEDIFGGRIPIPEPEPWLTSLPVESESIGFTSVIPGSVFEAVTNAAVNVDVNIPRLEGIQLAETNPSVAGSLEVAQDNRIRASVAMPIIANVMIAKTRLFALEQGLTVTGQAKGVVPLLRYEYLRDKAKEIISRIQDIESRMLPIQFNLDDFAQIVDTYRNQIADQEAELEATNQKINQLTQALTVLTQADGEVGQVVQQLQSAREECDIEWYDYLVMVVIVIGNIALNAVLGAFVAAPLFGIGAIAGAIAGAVIGAVTGVGLAYKYWHDKKITCDNVDVAYNDFNSARQGLQQGLQEVQAELNHELMVRDVLIANINALSYELKKAYQGNQARLLNAQTLTAIQSQYNTLRQSLLTRAQAVAKLAEEAFNFEQDSSVSLIQDAYYEEEKKGYTAAENLLRDLEGLDFINITGRTRKAMQLNQIVSLEKHYPMTFTAIKATGTGRFTTKLEEFDRWFPGTYMQRIKEVKVEVFVEGNPAPMRGYLSNDSVSFVRFSDPGNKMKVDGVNVFAEPDRDIAKLCYKRLQRRRHIDSMAFPDFNSYLHEERMRQIQNKERNYFENIGIESTWSIELLPDQSFDLLQITDIRVYFQYEAFFDENLKRVLQKKQYAGRREVGLISTKQLLEKQGKVADFSNTVTLNVTKALFEAPVVDKKIINVGFAIKPKEENHLNGTAKLEVSFEGATPIQLETNDQGVLATASNRPAGSNLANLEAMAHGKNADGTWTIKLVNLPSGVSADKVDDIFLMVNYEYA